MLAARAKIRGSDVHVYESGRRRVHIESVKPVSGPDGDRQGPPIRCQRRNPSVLLPYAPSDPAEPDARLVAAGTRFSKTAYALMSGGERPARFATKRLTHQASAGRLV